MGGALDQSHPCHVPGEGGGGGGGSAGMYTTYVCVRVCTCVCVCSMYMHLSTQHTHLHGMLQVPSGCTEAVDGVVLPNCVDPLTTRGHNT